MIMNLSINDRAALAIKNGTKRVEIRANKNNKHDYSKLNSNDIIVFNSNNLGVFYTKVLEVNHYNSIEDLLTLEGTKYTLSSTNDFNEGVKSINSIDGYQKAIAENGVYAIHLEYLYSEKTIWDELYNKAKSVKNPREVSGLISAGTIGAALITKNHNIYTGVCIDTASSLGICAERNAIVNMITNGESEISKLVCIDSQNKVGYPCGACREYMMQLDKNSGDIEILSDLETKETIKLRELIPNWWGKNRL